MNYFFSKEERDFNASLDAWELLLKMGFHENALYREGNTIRLFCPLHKDQIRRSLVIYTDTNTFKCQFTNCEGHKGGNLLEFYAAYMGCDVSEAMQRILNEGASPAEFVERAERLIIEGRYTDALPLLQKAVRLDSSNPTTRCRLAALYLELGDKENGYREYLAAAELLGMRGDYDGMVQIYGSLMVIRPDDIKVRTELAYLYSRLNREQDAVEQLKWVVDRHIRKGRLREAVDVTKKILDLAPTYPDAHRILGEVFLRQGKTIEAIDELTAAARHYIRENNLRRAKLTIELGLRHVPGDENLKDLKIRVEKALELQAQLGEVKDERELEFEQWLRELKRAVGVEDLEDRAPAAAPRAQQPVPEGAAEPEHQAPPTSLRGTILQGTFGHVAPPPIQEDSTLPKLEPSDPRVDYFRKTLTKYSREELETLRLHLVAMFDEVQKGVREGFCSDFEARVIREFYAAFCTAFDLVSGPSRRHA
ncbi:MAG: tetratricopeptide repeat protein [Candidatus Sumerlaeaceae bacterium]|nr:tetratricopeptide repeat protein [Candidatus Sumerlaeaceae bacterium]